MLIGALRHQHCIVKVACRSPSMVTMGGCESRSCGGNLRVEFCNANGFGQHIVWKDARQLNACES